MITHTYKAKAYIVNVNDPATPLYSFGDYTINICSYNGSTGDYSGVLAFHEYMLSQQTDIDKLGGSGIFTQGFDALGVVSQAFPALEVLRVPAYMTSTDLRLKLIFDSGDYLISTYSWTSSAAGHAFYAYDKNGNVIPNITSSLIYINGSGNSLTDPTYVSNAFYTYCVNERYFTETGFDLSYTSIMGYYISATNSTTRFYIYQENVFRATLIFLNRQTVYKPGGGGADPYGDGGTSEPGGGGGSFDDSTDVITIPEYDPVDLLNRSYGNRGFVRVYLPTQAELTQLHSFMWDNSLITEMQKMFNNVADAVISLNLLPLDFTDATPNRGNILMGLVDSQIETTIAKQQFVTLDCGTIEINEFFASYLDYSPYSKLQIYLPYIGVKDLDIDEFMNAYISVKYVIDIVSGACVAFISKTGAIDNDVVKNNPILGVLYQFAGNCALNVPISGANYAQVHAADIGALIGGAGVLGTFLTGGMSAPAAVTGILSTAANVVTSKPAISRGGSIPSTVGYMSIQKPYLILTRPRMCLPEDQNTFTGYPAYVTMTPGDTSGYTEFEIIHLENIPATDAEKNELETLMKTGVIL